MNDNTRRYAIHAAMNGGMDGGSDPSLIAKNQYALGINLTNRGDFVRTRPPFEQHVLSIDTDTLTRWTGKFQGAGWYDGENGESCILLARGGKLFKIVIGTLIDPVTEITPVLLIQVTADFTVPAVAATVVASVSDEAPFAVGDSLLIDSGSYTVQNRYLSQLLLLYNGGAANATVSNGTPVLDSLGNQVKTYQEHGSDMDLVYVFQAANYGIFCRGQFKTVFYDGASARVAGIKEIPPCLFGTYGWGRIWFVLVNQRNYGASDLIYGPNGTPSLERRDAVLKVTENDFLNEGGYFGVPSNMGPITSAQFLSIQDTSLGIGPLLVGTTNGVFSNQAPVDRTIWKNLTYPIQTISLLDYGPTGPRSVVTVNGDQWFRSPDGARSYVVARRNFPSPGNTPVSFEISNILNNDTESLLFYGSGVVFDNRLFMTVSPFRTDFGIQHRGLASINFDLVSSLRRKDPLAWEGLYTGLNVLQILKGKVNGTDRCFVLAERDDDIALFELLKDGLYDVTKSVSGNQTTIIRTAIEQVMITRSDTCDAPDDLKTLYMGELFISDIVDTVTIKVQFRPDQYPIWTDWRTLTFCANYTQCNISGLDSGGTCTIFRQKNKGYSARITLVQPLEFCSQTNYPIRLGYEFQFRITGTGNYKMRKFKAHTKIVPDKQEGECQGTVECDDIFGCPDYLFGYNIA